MVLNKIKKVYLFEWFWESFLDEIYKKSEIIKFKAWEIIIQEWEQSKNAYIILDWIVSVHKNYKNINTIFAWDIFWEISLVTNEPRTATIKAESDLELLSFSKEVLMKLIKNKPNGDKITSTILNRIIQNNELQKWL